MARIFKRLSITYGALWESYLEGHDLDEVAETWGVKLRGIELQQIGRALAKLGGKFPPNLMEFFEKCMLEKDLDKIADQFALPRPEKRTDDQREQGLEALKAMKTGRAH